MFYLTVHASVMPVFSSKLSLRMTV